MGEPRVITGEDALPDFSDLNELKPDGHRELLAIDVTTIRAPGEPERVVDGETIPERPATVELSIRATYRWTPQAARAPL